MPLNAPLKPSPKLAAAEKSRAVSSIILAVCMKCGLVSKPAIKVCNHPADSGTALTNLVSVWSPSIKLTPLP